MKIFEHIKAIIYLIIIIILAGFGLNHSFYGLMVSCQNSSIYEIDLPNIENENLSKNRYLKINQASSAVIPMVYVDESDDPVMYIYALTGPSSSNKTEDQILTSKIILESRNIINDWDATEIIGLLNPYWSSIDEEIIQNFEFEGIQISNDAEYLKLDTKPWNWYWHVLIISLAILFFYRMFEALYNKLKESDTKDDEKS